MRAPIALIVPFVLSILVLASGCSADSGESTAGPDRTSGSGRDVGRPSADGGPRPAEDAGTVPRDAAAADAPAGCVPGAQFCGIDTTAVLVCLEDGVSSASIPCPADERCVDGACASATAPSDGGCTPGATECVSRTVRRACGEAGEWEIGACPPNALCLGNDCVQAECVPNETACRGDEVTTCGIDARWGDVVERCGAGQCVGGACIGGCGFDGKTYVGCEFWGADLDHWEPGDRQQYAISVSNPGTTPVAVQIANGAEVEVATATIAPGALQTFPLPRQDVDHTSLSFHSYRVTANGPVTAHQFNPLNQSGVASNDASLLLPSTSLGREYLVLGWPTVSSGRVRDGRAYMTIIATEDDTEVTVTPTAAIEAGGGIPALAADSTHTFALSRGQVLSLGTPRTHGADITGSRIVASRNVAVFFGHECADIPLGTCCCDHIEQQLVPIDTWGRSVVAAKFSSRGTESDLWRILASTDGTSVTLDPAVGGVSSFTLNAGEMRELLSPSPFVIDASQPVLVGQFMIGSSGPSVGRRGCSGFLSGNAGDPAYTLNVPTEQWLDSYIVLTPQGFSVNHLTVVAPDSAAITLDGAPLTAPATAVGTSGFTLLRPEVAPGVHVVRGDHPFGLYAYGFDCYVSYAYPGGMRLEP